MAGNYYVAKDADIIGDVHLSENVSIWYHAVVRADQAPIYVGRDSNIQDNCVLHVSPDQPVVIGEKVTVGHSVILHGCTIEDRVLIGMGSIILNGAKIGKGSLIGAGTLVLENQIIPPNSLVIGSPARVIRTLTEDRQKSDIDFAAEEYLVLSAEQLEAVPVKDSADQA